MQNYHIGKIDFSQQGTITIARFKAMANPCSIYIEQGKQGETEALMREIANEAWRIEQKYSRYLKSSEISKINNSKGKAVSIDNETFNLLNLADTLWDESEGKFDISSGVLRKLWTFNDQNTIPADDDIKKSLHHIGWEKVKFDKSQIILPKGMQIDFGGTGKEYATDRCVEIGAKSTGRSILVNLGGDIAVRGSSSNKKPWHISIESQNGGGEIWKKIPLYQGAVATSGDVYKSFIVNGKRYGHIINALTGYPVNNAPRTVTVTAPNCTEAGILTTLALLQENKAESFLDSSGRPYWVQR